MQQPMRDPAAGVPRELLPHLHLVSKYRYPTLNHISLDAVVGYLTEAPKVVHDLQAVVWQFVEAPPDGTVFLVWQPLDYVGTNFASDGYVWGDVEQAFTSEHNGYSVEMWLHRGGYQPPNEVYTAHSRKRYRITRSKNPNSPQCDPSLWIIHYTRAERENYVLASQLLVQPAVQAALNQRSFIQSQGHLVRKEFMLHDKANWPTIHLPSARGAQGLQYPPQMIARQQAASAQTQGGAPQARNIPDRIQHRRGPSSVLEPTLEEEEDVSRGDLLDFMTPRDISKTRYEQHHEWMEEIMSSPYAMRQILPPDLGLGRKGELEALTSGFFDPPTSVLQDTSANTSQAAIGRMEVGKAEEFTARAARKVAEMEGELESLKKRHARRMAKVDKSSSLMAAERKLRTALFDHGRPSIFDSEAARGGAGSRAKVDEITGEVQDTIGKKIVPVSSVECVQKGRLDVKIPTPQDGNSSATNGGVGQALNESPPSASTPKLFAVSPQAETTDVQQGPEPPLAAPQQTDDQLASEFLSSQLPASLPGHQVPPPTTTKDAEMGSRSLPSLTNIDVDVDVQMANLDNQDQLVEEQMMDNDSSEWVMVDDVVSHDQLAEVVVAKSPIPQGAKPEINPEVNAEANIATDATAGATATATATSDAILASASPAAASASASINPQASLASAGIPGLSLAKAEATDPPTPTPQPAAASTISTTTPVSAAEPQGVTDTTTTTEAIIPTTKADMDMSAAQDADKDKMDTSTPRSQTAEGTADNNHMANTTNLYLEDLTVDIDPHAAAAVSQVGGDVDIDYHNDMNLADMERATREGRLRDGDAMDVDVNVDVDRDIPTFDHYCDTVGFDDYEREIEERYKELDD